jgi:ABC-type nitrate/sulfonate/bicarbonate transport system permease component
MTDRFGRGLWISWSGVAVVIVGWQLLVSSQLVSSSVFPGPVDVLTTAVDVLTPAELGRHIGASLLRVTAGFAAGTLAGVVVGTLTGWYQRWSPAIWGPLELLRPIPPLAWLPLALLWFGLGETSKVFVIFLAAFFPVATTTYKGVLGVDPRILQAAQTLGLRGWRLMQRVAVPAALPDIATGMRVGWSLSFGALVAAEILAAQEGMGFLIMWAREIGQTGLIVFGILVIGTLNLITDYALYRVLFRRRLAWHFGD